MIMIQNRCIKKGDIHYTQELLEDIREILIKILNGIEFQNQEKTTKRWWTTDEE